RALQQRQESARHIEHSEEIDGEVLSDCVEIAQIVVESDAGIVDENVERFNSLDSCLNLLGVSHVQGQGPDAPIYVGQGLARTGIYPPRTSPQGFLNQRLSNAAVGPGYENCFVCDSHIVLLLIRRLRDYC